ncbi:MAG: alginate export family protein [Acidobacteriota bacterium]
MSRQDAKPRCSDWVRQYEFNRHDSGTGFFGAYLTGKVGKRGWTADVYWLGLDRDRSAFGGLAGHEQRQTLGARLAGKAAGGFDFDLEGAFQFGHQAGRDIRAAMWGSQFGWTFTQASSRPRLYIGFDFASGDGASWVVEGVALVGSPEVMQAIRTLRTRRRK